MSLVGYREVMAALGCGKDSAYKAMREYLNCVRAPGGLRVSKRRLRALAAAYERGELPELAEVELARLEEPQPISVTSKSPAVLSFEAKVRRHRQRRRG